MNSYISTNKFQQKLLNWYQENKRDLPWRKTKDPYFIWISEIILQQTRIDQGTRYYLNFAENFPTIQHLASASEETVLKLWQGLGYYSRARNLHHAAQHISNELNGQFPNNYNDLFKLKGIGAYTAAAISSICFNEPKAVVDGNVFRVLSRLFGIKTPTNSSQGEKEFNTLAQKLIETNNSGDYNQALMEFGALHCKPQKPLCKECIFKKNCIAFKENLTDSLPVKLQKMKVKKRYFNYLVIEKNNQTILHQRTAKGIWKNLYEFPLIETETPVNQQLIQTHENFLKLIHQPDSLTLFNKKEWIHKLTHQHLHTQFWIVKTKNLTNNNNLLNWNDVKKLPVPRLIHKFIEEYNLKCLTV